MLTLSGTGEANAADETVRDSACRKRAHGDRIFAESNHGEGNTICAELQINTERLTVPHARLKERPFARKLLKEIL